VVKKMLSVITVCSLFVTLGGISYATPTEIEQIYSVNEKGYTINKENETDVTYVTVHEIPETIDVEIVDKQMGKSLFKEKNIPFLDVLSYAQKQNKGERKKTICTCNPKYNWDCRKSSNYFWNGSSYVCFTQNGAK